MRYRPLEQLLRIRTLIEERLQRELANRTAELRGLEKAALSDQAQALASRREAFDVLAESGQREPWFLRLMDADILEWKSERLRRHAEAERTRAAAAREAMLESRRERLRVDTLVEAARQAENREQARREQQRLDDWFQRRKPPGDRDEQK